MSLDTGDPLAGISAVAWERLYHAYGPATDVPGQLLALRSVDAAERSQALGRLFGNVYHQGTRWQASHAVVPFLVALIADQETPDRAGVLRLLTAIAVGDRRDDDLPFDPHQAFARTDDLGDIEIDIDITELLRRFYSEEALTDEEMDLVNAAAVRWEVDSYDSAARFHDTVAGWVSDPDDEVAALAAAAVVWFPPTVATVSALVAVPEQRTQPRASANLALAHLPSGDAGVAQRLRQLLQSNHGVVATTAAVALAYREAASLPDAALTILIDSAARDRLQDVTGWHRALRGFVMMALQRLGLA
ncbi:hypothetical protein BDK92_6704 [Micromonospora pisi]|uniref:HEAT repeat protein n=1 Tax=Micromonospora pisi TaxID=589240 RepID=A0A495JTE9_9ACTN|nr:hypothetical protein [Micromonospora pisi]RKR92266.1 hypothetical protein BDK92_6704 [Micromonospora pisi]